MITETQKKKFSITRILLVLFIMLLAFVQNGRGRFPEIFGARALLLIPAVTAIGMYEKDIHGIIFGLFAGALWDMVSAGGSFNALYLVCVGYISALLIKTIMRNNIITHLIISSAFSFIYCTGYWFTHYLMHGRDYSVVILLKYFIPTAVYTAVISVPIFFIVKAIEKTEKKPEPGIGI